MNHNAKYVQKRRVARPMGWLIALALGIPLFLAMLFYLFVYHINHFDLSLSMQGEAEIVLEYGQHFTDPGANATFSGSILIKEGMDVPVVVHGTVDENRLGTYELHYRAAHGKWRAEATRTVRIKDSKPPRILLISDPGTYVLPGDTYYEEGYIAWDDYDGDISGSVTKTQLQDRIIYSVVDSSGNQAQTERKLVYYDPVPPQITLIGNSTMTLTVGTKFQDPGFRATDHSNADLTDLVTVTGEVNIYKAGTYELTYSVQDRYGNASSISRTVTVKSVSRPQTVTPSGKVIYLTFDDGPGAYTRKLLNILKEYNVKATFFVVNTGYIDLVRDIVAEGHAVGVHSVSHNFKKIYASEDAFFDDVRQMQSIIEDQSGLQTTLLRFPGGSSNTVSKFNRGIMSRLTRSVEEMGFQYFDWNVDSNDAGGAKTKDEVYKNVINGVKGKRVSIVLQHDIKSFSVDAVEKIIQWGLENGYTFLPLSPTSPTAHHGVNN